MLFYFTATGNSLYVAEQLEAKPISIAQAIHDKNKDYTASAIGIVCPVFSHEMPPLVKKFLKESVFHTPYFYVILTYGNRHGGAPELARQFLESIGIHPAYINLILMVDNYLPAFDMAEQKKIDKKVDQQIAAVRADLAAKKNYIRPITAADRARHQEHLRERAKMPQDFMRHLYKVTDKCIGCGICTKVCPEKCFSLQGQKSVWHPDGCMMCLACIQACPLGAIQLQLPEKNPQARYRNENISINEIIKANNQWGVQ